MPNLVSLGFKIVATGGTQRYFVEKNVPSTKINKVHEGRPNVVNALKNGEIQLVLNTTETTTSQSGSKPIRQTALLQKVPPASSRSPKPSSPSAKANSMFGRCRIIFES